MAPPKVSVIISSYNHASFIASAIESVLQQTFTDFELIIADDASTDASAEIIRRFTDPRIRTIFRKENLGVDNFNLALKEARGTYIAMLGSDDIFLPSKLAKQVALLDAKDTVGVVFTHVEIMGKKNTPYALDPLKYLKYWFNHPNRTRHQWLRALFRRNRLPAASAMMRKDAIERVGYCDTRYLSCQDYDWWIRFCLAGYDLYIIPEVLTWYRRIRAGSNISAARLSLYNRVHFEQHKLLLNYLRIPDMQEFGLIFGHEKPYPADGPVAYYLACEALAMKTRTHRELALHILHDLLKDAKASASIKAQGFSLQNYYQLTTRTAVGWPISLSDWLSQSLAPLLSPVLRLL